MLKGLTGAFSSKTKAFKYVRNGDLSKLKEHLLKHPKDVNAQEDKVSYYHYYCYLHYYHYYQYYHPKILFAIVILIIITIITIIIIPIIHVYLIGWKYSTTLDSSIW